MIKSYDLPNGRKITADFDENEISKITVQALDSLISELNYYADKCEEYAEQEPCEALVSQMVQYIKAHDTPSLIELVIKAIKESEG